MRTGNRLSNAAPSMRDLARSMGKRLNAGWFWPLVILALPLTWPRAILVTCMIAGFVLLFPFAAVRKFFALELPTEVLGETLLIGVAGIAALIATTVLLQRIGYGPAAAMQARVPRQS